LYGTRRRQDPGGDRGAVEEKNQKALAVVEMWRGGEHAGGRKGLSGGEKKPTNKGPLWLFLAAKKELSAAEI